MVESYGDHAQRIDAHWSRHGGQPVWRRGLGAGLAWPCQKRSALMAQTCRWGCHSAWVSEAGTLHHGGQRRVLRRLLLAHQLPLLTTPPDSSIALGCF